MKDQIALFAADARRGSEISDRVLELGRQQLEMARETTKQMELQLELKKYESMEKRTPDHVSPCPRKPGKKVRK